MEQLIILSLSIAIMISPDTLALLGNFYGEAGIMGGFFLFGFMIFYVLLTRRYLSSNIVSDGELPLKNRKIKNSNTLLHIIQMVVKIPVLLFLATGLLVSSGFVFNEVFIFWFPNFGFAFLLLLFVLCLQWMKYSFRLYLQVVSSFVVVIGLSILVIKGLIEIDFANLFQQTGSSFNSITGKTIFLPMLLFIGFDLGTGFMHNTSINQKRPITFAICFIGIIFILWGFSMTAFIPGQKLIQSSIPHILTAKKIWGETGRYIIGGIIIAGTIASVNGLFIYVSTQVKTITQNTKFKDNVPFSKYLATVLIIIIGIFMAGGLAGSDRLEDLIRAALILWLISYSILPLLFNEDVKLFNRGTKQNYNMDLIKKVLILILPLIGSVILVTTDDNPYLVVKQILYQSIGISILVTILFITNKRNYLKQRERERY